IQVGGQNRRKRFQRSREATGALPSFRQKWLRRVAKPETPARVHRAQKFLRVWGREAAIETKGLLDCGMYHEQVPWRDAAGEDHFQTVLRRVQHGPEGLVELAIGNR